MATKSNAFTVVVLTGMIATEMGWLETHKALGLTALVEKSEDKIEKFQADIEAMTEGE